MAKGANQKQKLLYLAKMFKEKTDPDHGVSINDMISYLNSYDINADRKTLYLDIEELRHFGLEIEAYSSGRNTLYHLLSNEQDFELADLKVLVDSVQAAKFVSEKKSTELIRRLSSLVSEHEAKELQRNVVISGRVKTEVKQVPINIDTIHSAINSNRQIRFQYSSWTLKKTLEPRHGKDYYYTLSPMALVWDDENYYLVAYNEVSDDLRHFRVDKISHIEILEEKRKGTEKFKTTDLPKYSNSLFGMFGGEETVVDLRCENRMVNVLLDRFGTGIHIIPDDSEHFTTHVTVAASEQFLGWIIALGGGIEIIGPERMVERMREQARKLTEMYLK